MTIDVTAIPIEWDDPAESGITVDFGKIKDYLKGWDHKTIVPMQDYDKWLEFYNKMKFKNNLRPLDYTTAEFIASELRIGLTLILDATMKRTPYEASQDMIHFELWEGPHQAVIV